MIIEVNLSSEYGIMFLYDSEVYPTFPEEAGKDPVMYTSTCIAFNVLSYIDGDVKIVISHDRVILTTNQEYFAGKIECPSKIMSLYDHNGIAFASVPLKDNFALLSLRMSEECNPDVVECVIQNIATF
jgi:hypothetical protein